MPCTPQVMAGDVSPFNWLTEAMSKTIIWDREGNYNRILDISS